MRNEKKIPWSILAARGQPSNDKTRNGESFSASLWLQPEFCLSGSLVHPLNHHSAFLTSYHWHMGLFLPEQPKTLQVPDPPGWSAYPVWRWCQPRSLPSLVHLHCTPAHATHQDNHKSDHNHKRHNQKQQSTWVVCVQWECILCWHHLGLWKPHEDTPEICAPKRGTETCLYDGHKYGTNLYRKHKRTKASYTEKRTCMLIAQVWIQCWKLLSRT